MNKTIRKRTVYTAAPRYTLREIATMWFVHNGLAYCVQSAPDLIIRKATHGMIQDAIVKEVAQKRRMDIFDRWYVLCEAKKLKLYKTREEALGVQ